MKDKILQIENEAFNDLNKNISNLNDLGEIRTKYLGRTGILTLMLKDMKSVEQEERKSIGSLIGETRKKIDEKINEIKNQILFKEMDIELAKDVIDIQGNKCVNFNKVNQNASLHPYTLIENKLIKSLSDYNFNFVNLSNCICNKDKLGNKILKLLSNDIFLNNKNCFVPILNFLNNDVTKSPSRFMFENLILSQSNANKFNEKIEFDLLMIDSFISLGQIKFLIELITNKIFNLNLDFEIINKYSNYASISFYINLISDKSKKEIICKEVFTIEIINKELTNSIGFDNDMKIAIIKINMEKFSNLLNEIQTNKLETKQEIENETKINAEVE